MKRSRLILDILYYLIIWSVGWIAIIWIGYRVALCSGVAG